MKYWPRILLVVLAVLLYRECTRPSESGYRVKTITIPEQSDSFDIRKDLEPVTKDSPGNHPEPETIKETIIDSIYYQKYLSLKDSVERAEFVRQSALIHNYYEVYEDETQRVSVSSEVRGKLVSQAVDYTIFERKVQDTIFDQTPRALYFLPEIGTTTQLDKLRVKSSLIYQDKKQRLYSIGADTEGFIYVGVGIKF